MDKPGGFLGREALASQRGQPRRKKLVTVVLGDPQAYAWGGESIELQGAPAGELSSAGFSPLAGACVGLGYVRGAAANVPHQGTPAHILLWGERIPAELHDQWPPR
jgi:glycine cleavage system aminomethyltransferase T